MGNASQLSVLVEDERQQRFARHYLYRLGYDAHQIRFVPLPAGRGSGAQWVLDRYADEVRTYRHRSARAQTALLVAIDADDNTVTHRQRQLRERAERADQDKIAHLIPKWSIETWILCLSGEAVDEDQSYRNRLAIDDLIRASADTFFNWSRPSAVRPAHCTPSLEAAVPEVRRMK